MLEECGFTVAAEHLVSDPANQLATLLPQILQARPRLLVVGSGDGTIAAVVDHLAHTDTVLGYLPLATTNNFGRSLGLPLHLRPAVDVIAYGTPRRIDLGRVNGDYFANLVSIGISAEVAGQTPHELKRRVGRLAYAATAGKALFTHRPFVAEVISGDTRWRVSAEHRQRRHPRWHGNRSRRQPRGSVARRVHSRWRLPLLGGDGGGAPGPDSVAAHRAQGLPDRDALSRYYGHPDGRRRRRGGVRADAHRRRSYPTGAARHGAARQQAVITLVASVLSLGHH
jgi:hypothetical protein